MSRADGKEIPGLIDSLRPGDWIMIERAENKPPIEVEFVKSDTHFVYAKDHERRTTPRLWFRRAVVGRVPKKRRLLYTELL
jgi:hypothetical protein